MARERECVFLESSRATGEEHRSFLFLSPAARLTCRASADLPGFFDQAERYLAAGFYLAGWLSYEFGYLLDPHFAVDEISDQGLPLAELGVFPPPHIWDHRSRTFGGAGPLPRTAQASPPVGSYFLRNPLLNRTREEYLDRIARIKKYIEAGDTYQVNYTLKFTFGFEGSVEALYQALRPNQSVSFAALLKDERRAVLSFSPELFFRKKEDLCTVRPMKGTAGRGRTTTEDLRQRRLLQLDPKNRSENIMIVDLLRNDLGRLSRMGSVSVLSLFDVETYETLLQMTSTIRGHLAPGTSLAEIFRGLFPCGSVTGAPKIRTMEIIRELEGERRGIYTGAVGFIAPDGEACFNVPIRTVVLEDGRGEMGIGSGIVYDSEPLAEWEECRLKARFLEHPSPDFKLIETILWRPGPGFWLLEPHLERLADSARYFGFFFDRQEAEQALREKTIETGGPVPLRVRLLLAKDGEVSVSAAPLAEPQPATGGPLRITLSAVRTSSASPLLYHKTSLRELYDREHRRAGARGFFDVIFRNENEEITEGAITNVFIRKGDTFFTPPISCGLLPGVFRAHFMAEQGNRLQEASLRVKDLEEADALYVGNSVRGLIPVQLDRS